jgi:lipoprotein NlpI
MQEMAFWKYCIFTGVLGISSLIVPAWSQQAAPPSVPGPGADAKSYVDFGIYNGSKGQLDAAVAAFNDAIRIDPKYAPAYYNRGIAYGLQGKLDSALAEYNQTLKLDPAYRNAYFQRGSLEGQNGNFDHAISDFGEVIKLDPKYAPAYYNRGHAEYFEGNLNDAHTEIDEALRLDPNFPLSYYVRGLIQRAQGNHDQALADFQKSLGLGYPYAAFWVWITAMEDAQQGAAQTDLSNALGTASLFKSDDWSTQIGDFLLGKISQDVLTSKANTINDNRPGRVCEAWFYVGIHKRLSGDAKGAQECFAKAIATGAKGSEEFVEANRLLATP